MDIYYINSINQRIDFKDDLMIANTDLFDSLYTYEDIDNRIRNIRKGIKETTLELHLHSNAVNERFDALCEVLEVDVLSNKPGRLYVSSNDTEYYLECFVMENLTSSWFYRQDYMYKTLKVVSQGCWKKEHQSLFSVKSSEYTTKTYMHTYPYQYQVSNSTGEINNPSYIDAHFTLEIFGPVINPSVTIGDNSYEIYTQVLENEVLIVDYSSEAIRKITKKDSTKLVESF